MLLIVGYMWNLFSDADTSDTRWILFWTEIKQLPHISGTMHTLHVGLSDRTLLI